MSYAYAINYLRQAFTSDELAAPDTSKTNGHTDALFGIYLAHKAGGVAAVQRSWQTVKQQAPDLAKVLEIALSLIHADELITLSMPVYMLDDYPLYSDSFNVVVGPSGSGKSFVTLDVAGRIALHRNVVYIAGEGLAGYAARWEAWKSFHQVETANLWFYKEALQLLEPQQFETFVDIVKQHQPALVIVDTLARSAVGVDENSAKDMGEFVNACDRLKNALQCGLVVVHHTGKSGEIRGSTSLYGAADAVLAVSKVEGLVRVTNRAENGGKNKFGADDFEAWFNITSYDTTNGLSGAVLTPAERLKDDALDVNEKELALLTALARYEDGITVKLLCQQHSDFKNATAYRTLYKLQSKGFVHKNNNLWSCTDKALEVVSVLGADASFDEALF